MTFMLLWVVYTFINVFLGYVKLANIKTINQGQFYTLDLSKSLPHLFDEDLGHVTVVVEGGQVQRREAVLLLNVHQLSRPGEDFLCGPAVNNNNNNNTSLN